MKRNLLLTLLLISLSISLQGQNVLTGTLLADDGLPLPGATVKIKGSTKSTTTDFDGNYSIECNVGDILIFNFLGYTNRILKVTSEMFAEDSNEKIQYIPTQTIHSKAYANAVKKQINNKVDFFVPSLSDSKKTFNTKNLNFQYNRIKKLDIKNDKVNITYFKPDIYFETAYTSSFGVQFVKNKNLPELQNSFSQGNSISGKLVFQGPETENEFSYGPSLSSLGFSASSNNNLLFKSAITNSNHIFFNTSTDEKLFAFNFFNENSKDIYNRELNSNNTLSLNFKNEKSRRFKWKTFITYQVTKDNQPNINGFQNNMLLNFLATPPSFNNQQGFILPNNTQRRFNSRFNNPKWLLNYNRNSIKDNVLTASVQNDINISESMILESKLNYKYDKEEQKFGLIKGTAGFKDGFFTYKNIKENNVNGILNFGHSNYISGNQISIKSNVNYMYEDVGFLFQKSTGFAPFMFNNAQNNSEVKHSISRSIIRLQNQFEYAIDNKFELKFINNSYYSSIQNNNWFLPSLYAKVNLVELFYVSERINKISISSNASFNINDTPIYYGNLSHNSLLLTPQESLRYTANNDLFVNSTIELEEKESYEIGASFGLNILGGYTDFNFTYYNAKTKGSVFPIINNQTFQLDNVADIKNRGFEFSIDSRIRITDELFYEPMISFSTYKTKVLNLLDDELRIPIAGFSTTSKNLIVGQPAGVIVGSAYMKDEQNNIVIGADGFPLVSQEPQIIGNPLPDFNIGINNNFEWENLKISMIIDIQKGGDIWNGTQNVLNYIGTSQQSALERGTTNFVFDGVNQQGEINTIPIDFYNPNNSVLQNRFSRYGFEGVAEEAIVDGSYINLKSLDISYLLFNSEGNKEFLRECELGFYAKNLFTWSKFRGYSPYNTLYGNSSGQELNFFNTPLQSEVGLTLKIKI